MFLAVVIGWDKLHGASNSRRLDERSSATSVVVHGFLRRVQRELSSLLETALPTCSVILSHQQFIFSFL